MGLKNHHHHHTFERKKESAVHQLRLKIEEVFLDDGRVESTGTGAFYLLLLSTSSIYFYLLLLLLLHRREGVG